MLLNDCVQCVCLDYQRRQSAEERDESEIIVADGVVHLYYQSLQLPTCTVCTPSSVLTQ